MIHMKGIHSMIRRTIVILCMLMLFCLMACSAAFGEEGTIFKESQKEIVAENESEIVVALNLSREKLKNISHKANSEKTFLYFVNTDGVHIFPIAAGKGTITLTNSQNKKDTMKIVVTIPKEAIDNTVPHAVVVINPSITDPGEEIAIKYHVRGIKPPFSINEIRIQSTKKEQQGSEILKLKKLPSGVINTMINGDGTEQVHAEIELCDKAGNAVTAKSNTVYINHLEIEDLLGDYEAKQMTLEEFKENVKAFKDYLKPWRTINPISTKIIGRIYYALNVESCEDILQDLVNEGLIPGYYIFDIIFREFYFESNDFFHSTRQVKEKLDLSVAIYDQRHKEIYNAICTPIEERICEYHKTGKFNMEKLRGCIEEIDRVKDYLSVQDIASIILLERQFTLDMETYIHYKIPKKKREEYLDMEKSADNHYVLKQGVVLDKNSKDECELLIYAHNYLDAFERKRYDEDLLEYDNKHWIKKNKK